MINSLRILGKVYSVTQDDIAMANKGIIGECTASKCQIVYSSDQAEQQLKDTILHEAIHAIDYTMNLGLEERQVHALAGGVLALLLDNPDFVDYLTNGTHS
jgi:hypothetical protein